MAPGYSGVKVASTAIRDSLRAVALTGMRICRLVLLTSINTDPMERPSSSIGVNTCPFPPSCGINTSANIC